MRIITALNEEPEILIKQERLRKDFYYRLAIIKLDIEPLKEKLFKEHWIKMITILQKVQNP